MLTPRWLLINKRKMGSLVVIAGLLIVLITGVNLIFFSQSSVDTEKTFEKAMDTTFASRSFRFSVETKLLGGNQFYSKVEGERVMPDKVHIKGTVLKTPVEFTQVDDDTYMKDIFTGKWLSLKGNQLSQSELFITELNPLANFNFKDIPEIKYLGEEKVDGEKLLAYELKPNIENVFMENQFTDFTYKVWVSKKDNAIRQALIKANAANNSKGGLEIFVKLWEYNRSIKIDVPQEHKGITSNQQN